MPAGNTTPTIFSKRDVGQDNGNQPCCSNEADRRLLASRGGTYAASEQHMREDIQSYSAESILELITHSPTPTPIIEQQAEEPVNDKKKGKPAMERLREQAKKTTNKK